jgi:hypothetical protein
MFPRLKALGRSAKRSHKFVILSEVSAARSAALTQSKDPYYLSSSRCCLREFSQMLRQSRKNALLRSYHRKQCRDPSTPFLSREARDKFRSG